MNFRPFELQDLSDLTELQPPDWGDLVPRFEYFIASAYCNPIKLVDNYKTVAVGANMKHTDTAWLACIVVHPAFRNRGFGNILTQRLIEDLDRQKYKTIFLDATHLGYPVYKKIGFEEVAEYTHLKRDTSFISDHVSENIVPYHEKYHDQILELDKEISGENRVGILSDFIGYSQIYLTENQVQGFYIPDWGDGPVIAKNDQAGLELMKLRILEKTSAVIPFSNKTALNFLTNHGFKTYKTSKRMQLGQSKTWNSTGSFNWISGQLG